VCLNIFLLGIHLVKTITIRDEVYRKLTAIKRKGESFSELFDRLAECQDSRETLTKLRATVEFKNKEQMLSELSNLRAERRS
jgi:predicted CopG family antitoxin